jgi:hypothetical protein
MDNTVDNEVINDEPFSFYSLITYIKENIAGLSLLILAVLIIIFVDYISRINAIIFSGPATMPLPNVIPGGLQLMQINKSNKARKIKRR